MSSKYLFVVGGVMSGIGKGIATASIARIFKDRGLIVAPVKIDPYINVDAGTMNPIEHGEVFVTEDGKECDQDLGNYERFLGEALPGSHSITTGQIYQTVIARERNLGYHGRCVEAVPDIPNELITRLTAITKQRNADIVLVEIGGTVGEYQNLLYLETARLMRRTMPARVAVVLVSYLPIPSALGEMKTKPTQQAVRILQEAGLQPDIIIARGVKALDPPRKRKLALFCNVSEDHIISSPDTGNIYEVPKGFEKDRLSERLFELFRISEKRYPRPRNDLSPQWQKLLRRIHSAKTPLRIGIVGKYFTTGTFVLRDAYVSVLEALKHASWEAGRLQELVWIDAERFEHNPKTLRELSAFSGLIVPGGFGSRGVEGKIRAIRYAREHRIPYLGLCYGMQLAVVEFARNVAGLTKANTTENAPKTPQPVIDMLPEQRKLIRRHKLGGTMRLGTQTCAVTPGTIAAAAYGKKNRVVNERHRHRYEVNNDYRELLEQKGLVVSGVQPERDLVEMVELPRSKHPFFLGTQFHPELQSTPLRPHPLFRAFIQAATNQHPKRKKQE